MPEKILKPVTDFLVKYADPNTDPMKGKTPEAMRKTMSVLLNAEGKITISSELVERVPPSGSSPDAESEVKMKLKRTIAVCTREVRQVFRDAVETVYKVSAMEPTETNLINKILPWALAATKQTLDIEGPLSDDDEKTIEKTINLPLDDEPLSILRVAIRNSILRKSAEIQPPDAKRLIRGSKAKSEGFFQNELMALIFAKFLDTEAGGTPEGKRFYELLLMEGPEPEIELDLGRGKVAIGLREHLTDFVNYFNYISRRLAFTNEYQAAAISRLQKFLSKPELNKDGLIDDSRWDAIQAKARLRSSAVWSGSLDMTYDRAITRKPPRSK